MRGLVLVCALVLVAALLQPSGARATGLECCGSSSGGGGASTFDAIGSGSNTTATMTCGTGCSITTSGSGSNTATDLVCATNPCVSNAETTATSANTASAIVARDGSGNFTAGTITAALAGNATSATSATSATTATTATNNTLLLGRTGSTNDTILSTDGDGSLYGSHVASKKLILRPNNIDTNTGSIQLDAPTTVLYSDFPASTAASFNLITASPTATLTGGTGNFQMVVASPTLSVADTLASSMFVASPTLDRTGTSGGTIYQITGYTNSPVLTSSSTGGPLLQDAFYDHSIVEQVTGTATQNTYQPISFLSKPLFKADSGATLTIGQTTGVDLHPGWGATGGTFTNTTYSAVRVHKPCVDPDTSVNQCAGAPTLATYVGLDVQDLAEGVQATVTSPISLRSIGTTTSMRHAGPARFGATGAPSAGYSVDSAGAIQIGTAGGVIPDVGAGTGSFIDAVDTVAITANGGQLNGLNYAPTTAMTDSSTMRALYFNPTITQSGSIKAPAVNVLDIAGTVTNSVATNLGTYSAVHNKIGLTSATSTSSAGITVYGLWDEPQLSYTGATFTSGTTSTIAGFFHNPVATLNAATATWPITDDIGFFMTGTFNKAAGTALTVTNRRGIVFNDVTLSGSATLANNVAVDVAALANGATERTALRSAIAANSAAFFLHDTGGAQSSLKGKITTYNNVAADANHNGVPFTIASTSATAQAANIAAADILASGSVTAGRYRLCGYVAVTRQATTTSTVPNVALTCTDPTDSVAKTVEITAAVQGVAANPTTAVAHSGCGICDAKVSTAIQWSTTDYASTGGTTMQYKVYVTLEAM